MGIRGLTTFIENRSHLYMEQYELHHTNIVIDGNSVACQLYRQHCHSNDCFGGDYDIYGQLVLKFFHILFECKVTPYIVFDGGYEDRKVVTVINRMLNKINAAEQLDSVTESSMSVFPLFLRDVFLEIVQKLNIRTVRCDFEGDADTASIARTLNCPVLSYDSDYFVLDVQYIPFSTFEMRVKLFRDNETKTVHKYISCEIYKVEKFLLSFPGLDKKNLALLAVLLGNDYVKRKTFALFFQNLKKRKIKGKNEQQTHIKSVIVWLQNETMESALKVVLNRYKTTNRQKILEKIQNAMKGYFHNNSKYLEYLGITSQENIVDSDINFSSFLSGTSENDLDSGDESIHSEDDCTESDSSHDGKYEKSIITLKHSAFLMNVPMDFLHNFRKCIYPPCFMDIISRNQYYCIPQVENSSLEFAHNVSLDILSAIHKIITNSDKQLICICRVEKKVGKRKVPRSEYNLPLFADIYNMNVEDRVAVFLRILNINKPLIDDYVKLFPKPWQLFVISIIYFMEKSIFTWPLIFSLLLVKLVLQHIDMKIGIYRTKREFDHFYSKTHFKYPSTSQNVKECSTDSILEELTHISYIDSLKALKNLVIYFQMEEKMKSHRKLFDRNLVHSLAQFQSILMHLKYLNRLLCFPFDDTMISDSLNCTFIYNFTVNLKRRTSLENYIELLLKDSPTVLNCFILIVNKLKEYFPENPTNQNVVRRKKKKKEKQIYVAESVDISSEEESSFDPNNKFSLLYFNKS